MQPRKSNVTHSQPELTYNMWVPRTPEEVIKWQAAADKEARFQGVLFGVLIWAGVVFALSAGLVVSSRWITLQQSVSGTFWTRFPVFAIPGLPFAFWLFRREKKAHLDRAMQMTICPK